VERNAAAWNADNLCLGFARQKRYPGFDQNSGYDVAQDRPNPNGAQGSGQQGSGQQDSGQQDSGQMESGQILAFQLRRRAGTPRHAPITPDGGDAEPVDDLAAFEEEDGHIDYQHRMLMNVFAVVIVSILITAGVWIADTIAAMQKVQDCALQGRQNCAPIELPVIKK
jgi:hypothetical protein